MEFNVEQFPKWGGGTILRISSSKCNHKSPCRRRQGKGRSLSDHRGREGNWREAGRNPSLEAQGVCGPGHLDLTSGLLD